MPNTPNRTRYIPIDDRIPQSTVRALILARTSNPGGGPADVESQVDQSLAFVRAMGWTLIHPDDLYFYTDAKSGMRRVRRPALTAALKMAQQDKVDVIVCLKLARIDRKAPRRSWAIETAAQFGVEFRFVNHAETRGRLPEGELAELQRFIEDMYDEREAKEIAARLSPGKLKRYEQGLPHGGRAGPLYGYAEGQRRYKSDRTDGRGRPMGLLTWVIDESKAAPMAASKAEWVRRLVDTVDQTDIRNLSLRGLARWLEDKGAPTATGEGHWSAKQVYNLLRNGKYAGVGRNLRYEVIWDQHRDRSTHEVAADSQTKLRDKDKTYDVSTTAVPPIITDRAKWDRVQAKLDALREQNNRGGPRRTDAAAHASLLDGFVRCVCGGKMTRYWDHYGKRPFYHCGKRSGTPLAPCRRHEIAAHKVDALALRLLAETLTDPERILEIADAAEAQLTRAESDAALAEASAQAYNKTIAKIDADREKLRVALKALTGVPGAEGAIVETRARLDALDAERVEAEAARDAAVPEHGRATARAAFLRELFTVRDVDLDFTPGSAFDPAAPIQPGEPTHLEIGWAGVATGKVGRRIRTSRLPLHQAAALLQVPESEIATLGLPVRRGEWGRYENDDGTWEESKEFDTVSTADVIECLLKRMSRDRLHKLLGDLEVVVRVKHPRSRAEWAVYGPTPATERVTLEVLGTVVVRSDAANVSRFS
jgi:site-specific DNA recombinase